MRGEALPTDMRKDIQKKVVKNLVMVQIITFENGEEGQVECEKSVR